MINYVLFVSFFVFLILGIPIGICLGLSSICAIHYQNAFTDSRGYQYVFRYQQISVAGDYFSCPVISWQKPWYFKRLIRFVDTWWDIPEAVSRSYVIVACFFGAISGSGPATVAALGMVLIPAMIERGSFPHRFCEH